MTVAAALGWAGAFKAYKAEVLTKAADDLVDHSQFTRAEAFAAAALKLNPRSGYAWFQYSTSQYLQLHFDEAIEGFRQAIPLLPHSYNALRLMAIAQYKKNRYEPAAENFSDYLLMNPQPSVTPEEIFRMAGLSWLRVGNLSDANQYLTWASYYAEEKGDILKVQAMVTILMNQPGTADYYFRSFRHFEPDEDFNPYELVANAIAANKLNGAVAFLSSIHERNPADLSVVKALAMAYSRIGSSDKAVQLLQRSATVHPENAELRLIFGDVLYAQRKFPEAFEQYDLHLRLAPDSQFRQDILKKKATSR